MNTVTTPTTTDTNTNENTMKFNDMTNTTTTEDKIIVIMPGGDKLIIESENLHEYLEEIINSHYLIPEEAEGVMEYIKELSYRLSMESYGLGSIGLKQEIRDLEDELGFELFRVDEDFYEKGIDKSHKEERHYFSRVTISHSERELW